MNNYLLIIKNNSLAIALAVFIGIFSYALSFFLPIGIADPLIIALVLGMCVNFFPFIKKFLKPGFEKLPFVFIPIGVVFYGLKNLNFSKATSANLDFVIIVAIVVLTYYLSSIVLGRFLNLKKEITFLTATGGAICGASAITVTAPAVDADSDDISISLLAVFIAAAFALFVVLPFLGVFLDMSNQFFGLMAGSVLQFTGFVKASISTMPHLDMAINQDDVMGFALSIKAMRYLGLLLAIPLFATLVKGRLSLPWYLWAFLASGIVGTYLYSNYNIFYKQNLIPMIEPTYNILWSVSMAAVGINARVKHLFSDDGLKAIFVAFASFGLVIAVFLLTARVFNIF